ncbi:MAG TPA: hypothetical protein VIJ68_03785 [Candidatus Saccharimonadales bacterium]
MKVRRDLTVVGFMTTRQRDYMKKDFKLCVIQSMTLRVLYLWVSQPQLPRLLFIGSLTI